MANALLQVADGDSFPADFGFQAGDLQDALAEGANGAVLTSALHPIGRDGRVMYDEVTRALRETLAPSGYRRHTDRGCEFTYSDERRIAIVVVPGDENTGIVGTGRAPSTKHPRGEVTAAIVAKNQCELFDLELNASDRLQLPDGVVVWFLLHRLDRRTKQVFAELSQPSGISTGGFVQNWETRIIIPVVEIAGGGDFAPLGLTPRGAPPASVDVPVSLIRAES